VTSDTQRDQSSRDNASRQWRTLWRVHFYAGMFAMPFILLMAITGLVILYTGPIQDLTQGDLRKVEVRSGPTLSLDEQAAAVANAYPKGTIGDVTPPEKQGRSTRFFVDDGSPSGRHVFVDPFSGKVLGSVDPSGGIVGLANRLHGFLNNESVTVPLPAVSTLWDGDQVIRDYVLGDLILEILGVWTLVLIASGLYLFWPRRSSQSEGTKGRRRLFGIRTGATGRARWRDLHGVAGLLLLPIMAVTIISGLAWSTYWGPTFSSLADKVTPGTPVDQPPSVLGVRGDLDRFGNQIPWATGDFPIPASYAPEPDGSKPAPMRLDDIARIAEQEGMKPGYTISLPTNEVDESGNAVYGSFALANSWPRKTGEARDVFLDQFRGTTLAEQTVYGYGPIAVGMDTLVSFHMGTQLGLFNRILMTLLCVLAIWSVVSAAVMFAKRRRPGSLGLPRRPVDVSLTPKLVGAAVIVGIIFPTWAAVALVILALDRFVIRRVPRLRHAFGQPW
jgi:uncharacterized iron-regulated membrane protein